MGTEILKGAKAHPSYFTAARENTRKIDTTFATKNFSKTLRHDYEFYYVFHCVEKKAFRAFVFYVSKLSFIIKAKPTEVAPQWLLTFVKHKMQFVLLCGI